MLKESTYVGSGVWGNCAPTALHELAPDAWGHETILEACLEASYNLRTTGRGMYRHEIDAVLRTLDVETEEVSTLNYETQNYFTLAQFLRKYGSGDYWIETQDHVLVARDGEVIDPNYGKRGLRRRIRRCYRVLNAGSRKYAAATNP